jgi:hypothetical protein
MNQPSILAKINYKRSISPAPALCSRRQCGRDDVPRAAAATAAGSSEPVSANLFSLVLVIFIRKLLSSAPACLRWISRCCSRPLLFPQQMTSTLLSGQRRDELLPSASQGVQQTTSTFARGTVDELLPSPSLGAQGRPAPS